MVEDDLERGTLVRLLSEYEVTPTDFGASVYALYPSREYVPAKVRAFLSVLRPPGKSAG